MQLKALLNQRFSSAMTALGIPEDYPPMLALSGKPEFGDFQVNGAMRANKRTMRRVARRKDVCVGPLKRVRPTRKNELKVGVEVARNIPRTPAIGGHGHGTPQDAIVASRGALRVVEVDREEQHTRVAARLDPSTRQPTGRGGRR